MPSYRSIAEFTLEDLHQAVAGILQAEPDPVPTFRLVREVLRVLPDDPELRRIQAAVERSEWLRRLENAQLPDGSWGRFHSQDTKVKSVFRTSEEAIDRAFALGLEPVHPVLTRAKAYIENVLREQAHITDREEKSEAWPLLIQFILAGRLAQIDPANPLLDDGWSCLAEVTRRAFASGTYRLVDETEAYLQLASTRVPKGFLESQHALWILSARQLPSPLEQNLTEWIWNKPDGIRYLGASLSKPSSRNIGFWLRSMNILTRFRSWRDVSVNLLNSLWNQHDEDGMWDFGSQTTRCTEFPISENWRRRMNRKVDYSTSMLVLFRRYFD